MRVESLIVKYWMSLPALQLHKFGPALKRFEGAWLYSSRKNSLHPEDSVAKQVGEPFRIAINLGPEGPIDRSPAIYRWDLVRTNSHIHSAEGWRAAPGCWSGAPHKNPEDVFRKLVSRALKELTFNGSLVPLVFVIPGRRRCAEPGREAPLLRLLGWVESLSIQGRFGPTFQFN